MLEEKIEQKRLAKEVEMIANRLWVSYPATYRSKEIKILAGWISSQESGSVVGLSGCGRSNLLGFLCYRPEVLQNLTALEGSILSYLIKHPRVKHTKTDLIIHTWPNELHQEGVSDNSLYQVIFTIRKAIEPNPGEPSHHLAWKTRWRLPVFPRRPT